MTKKEFETTKQNLINKIEDLKNLVFIIANKDTSINIENPKIDKELLNKAKETTNYDVEMRGLLCDYFLSEQRKTYRELRFISKEYKKDFEDRSWYKEYKENFCKRILDMLIEVDCAIFIHSENCGVEKLYNTLSDTFYKDVNKIIYNYFDKIYMELINEEEG